MKSDNNFSCLYPNCRTKYSNNRKCEVKRHIRNVHYKDVWTQMNRREQEESYDRFINGSKPVERVVFDLTKRITFELTDRPCQKWKADTPDTSPRAKERNGYLETQ